MIRISNGLVHRLHPYHGSRHRRLCSAPLNNELPHWRRVETSFSRSPFRPSYLRVVPDISVIPVQELPPVVSSPSAALDDILNFIFSLHDTSLRDALVENNLGENPASHIGQIASAFLDHYGKSNAIDFNIPKEGRNGLQYHSGLDSVRHRETEHGYEFFLTAGACSIHIKAEGTTYSVTARNAGRAEQLQTRNEPPQFSGMVHRQIVKSMRVDETGRTLPLRFLAGKYNGDEQVKGASYGAVLLKDGKIPREDMNNLRAWYRTFWNASGLSNCFDTKGVAHMVTNTPPHAGAVREVLAALKDAYADSTRAKLNTYLQAKRSADIN